MQCQPQVADSKTTRVNSDSSLERTPTCRGFVAGPSGVVEACVHFVDLNVETKLCGLHLVSIAMLSDKFG